MFIIIYMKVEYNNSKQRCLGEIKSKLLLPYSDLYNYIIELKTFLRNNGFLSIDRMDLHTEVLNDNNETLETFLERVKMLEGLEIDVKNKNNYKVVGRAVALILGDLQGYNKKAKITIAFFNNNDAHKALELLLNNIKKTEIFKI